MFTLQVLYNHLSMCMLLDSVEVNYSERMVALELMAHTFGWQYQADLDFVYTYMKKSGLFTVPIETRMSPPLVVADNKNRGRILGVLPAGMGL